MKQNKILCSIRLILLVCCCLAVRPGAAAASGRPVRDENAVDRTPSSTLQTSSSSGFLKPGDLIYTDSGNPVSGGFIIKVDPNTGEQSIISSGGLLSLPLGVLVDRSGKLVVSDRGRLLAIDPATGLQAILAENSAGLLGYACGMALDHEGNILVANLDGIVRVNPETGRTSKVSSGGGLQNPIGVAVGEHGEIIALNFALEGALVRINPHNGAQSIVSRGSCLRSPQALVVHEDAIYVTALATPDGNFGIGRVVRVDSRTGVQKVISEGGYLIGPVGIAMDAQGQLLVADPCTVNPESPDLYDGGIIRIDPASGTQTLLARGHKDSVNPRGVAVVSTPSLQHKSHE